MGQICVSPNRVFVERAIYERFLERVVMKVGAYEFGVGDDHEKKEDVLQPVVSEHSLQRLLRLVDDARVKGARVLCGGCRENRPGFFLQPTVIADVSSAMAVQQGEVFGPILPVRPFDGLTEAIELANDSEVGLSSYVYTSSLDTAMRAEEELMTGNVCINGAHYSIELPHGGLKQSGCGKDISHLSLHDYYDVRRISMKRRSGN